MTRGRAMVRRRPRPTSATDAARTHAQVLAESVDTIGDLLDLIASHDGSPVDRAAMLTAAQVRLRHLVDAVPAVRADADRRFRAVGVPRPGDRRAATERALLVRVCLTDEDRR